jgi:4a-hydroxytetrahydrobiopterin dehydratase
MSTLRTLKCVPCRGGEAPLNDSEIGAWHRQIPTWAVVEQGGIKVLQRTFKFKNFARAIHFTAAVGALAEEEGHHPAILTEWGQVTVTWWTHASNGLHLNDFIMASKTDSLFAA